MTACTQPGCTGQIQDGYCMVCGMAPAAGGDPMAEAGSVPTAVKHRGGSTGSGTGSLVSQPMSARTSSRLASAAFGSARTSGTRATRRTASASTRFRGRQLGAGITTIPPVPITDPLEAVLADPQVAEHKRFCPSCGAKVGRSRDGVPARTSGFCPSCGSAFDFDPTLGAGDLVGGQYEVVGPMAHGGLGWIYLARDINVSGRFVVLKGLLNSGDRDAYDAAVAEREFLAEVEHPLIVEIYNFARHQGAGYTVMEYVGGRSLKEILMQRREAAGGTIDPLPVDQALAYILEILPAFSYLHEKNLLYCDFKPDNLIQQGESVKLIDMGGVRRLDDETSAIYGTVGYQAPEVATEGPSIASDIYTIGRTLVTLVLDFRGNTSTYVASLPPVAATPVFERYDSFYRLVAKACALNPSDRFASVAELRSQVLGVLRDVVAVNRTEEYAARHSHSSANFEAPASDAPNEPIGWQELPRLKVDQEDPMASWLAGIPDTSTRVLQLRQAPTVTLEVRLARIHAAIRAEQYAMADAEIAEVLAADPWEWRALWLAGLRQLATGDEVEARSSFNAVYSQVPGELAPKLALAAVCERSGELRIAEGLYRVCAASDANYAGAAAFGMARIRAGRQDAAGTLRALDLVAPTRSSYSLARVRRAGVLVDTASSFEDLAEALTSIDDVSVADSLRLDLTIAVRTACLRRVLAKDPGATQGGVPRDVHGVPAREKPMRLALEQAYRERARLATSDAERVSLVDRANQVRPRTLV